VQSIQTESSGSLQNALLEISATEGVAFETLRRYYRQRDTVVDKVETKTHANKKGTFARKWWKPLMQLEEMLAIEVRNRRIKGKRRPGVG
jgi:hypothetical protein